MIAADSSSIIAYFGGSKGKDTKIIYESLLSGSLYLPPVVVTELLSDYKVEQEVLNQIARIHRLVIKDGYWERAGLNRSIILSKKLKARTADALIAQSCIDHDIPLITRDSDFKHFEQYCGLRLL